MLCSPFWSISKKSPCDIILSPLIGWTPEGNIKMMTWVRLDSSSSPSRHICPRLLTTSPFTHTLPLLTTGFSNCTCPNPKPSQGDHPFQVPKCIRHITLPSGDSALPLLSTMDNICIIFSWSPHVSVKWNCFLIFPKPWEFYEIMYAKSLARCQVQKIYFSHQEKDCTVQKVLHPPSLF